MAHNQPGVFLNKLYTSMAQQYNLQLINSYHHLTAENLDKLVEMEMKHLKASYQNEEECYIEKMLQENPIKVERRSTLNISGDSEESSNRESVAMQQQRAESCRKSRINSKIKKAKLKHRHTFVSNKLAQNAKVLACIHDVIAQAESQLLRAGYSPETLAKLRSTFGVDR